MKFTAFADMQDWSAKQRRYQLCFCLEGRASDFFTRVTESETNIEYFDLVQKLEQKFEQELPVTSQMQFQNIAQRSEESVTEWLERVKLQGYLAFGGYSADYIQCQMVMKFCQGLAVVRKLNR